MPTTLQHELGKQTPFEHPEEEAYLNLLRTMSLLANQTERLLRAHGLSEAAYNTLRIVRGHRQQAESSSRLHHGVPCSVIAHQLVAQVPDLTRLVDRLVKAGLVTRCRSETDRRVVLIDITDHGLAALDGLEGPLPDLHQQQLGHLTRAELAELNRLLVKAREPHGPQAPAAPAPTHGESPPSAPANHERRPPGGRR